jgi:hypothetical protein
MIVRRSLTPLLVCFAVFLLALSGSASGAAKAKSHALRCASSLHLLGLFSDSEPAPIATPLDPTVLSQYAVLRRAAVSEDVLPPLNKLGGALEGKLASYYPAYIRRLSRLPDGGRYFLITGFERAPTIPPASCLPKSLRPNRPHLVALAHDLAVEPAYCIGVVEGLQESNEGVTCQRYSTVYSGAGLAEETLFVLAGSKKQTRVELAPDGVASVRLRYPGAAPLTATVSENAYVFSPPPPDFESFKKAVKKLEAKKRAHPKTKKSETREGLEGLELFERFARRHVPKVEWLGAEGQLIKSFTPKHEGSLLEQVVLPVISSSGISG